jgi:hypothetical protein
MHTQQDPSMLDQLAKNITRHGITNSTLNYLRVSFSKVKEAHRQLRALYGWFYLNSRHNQFSTIKQT